MYRGESCNGYTFAMLSRSQFLVWECRNACTHYAKRKRFSAATSCEVRRQKAAAGDRRQWVGCVTFMHQR